ncbi:MAG TPA: hypothetical protein VFA32_21910 [Dehalococcoidia bacterium]|nr:hypothetical protein [Dehalococcoidia bacterium]
MAVRKEACLNQRPNLSRGKSPHPVLHQMYPQHRSVHRQLRLRECPRKVLQGL